MKVIGYSFSEFDTKDGGHVSGCFLYLTEERRNVTGVASERIFLSNAKLGGYKPSIGDEVRPYYNKYGKVDFLELL